MLLLNINREVYVGSPMVRLHITLVTLKGQSQGHSDFEALYPVKNRVRPYVTIKQVCRKWPFVIPTAGVKLNAKVHGPLVSSA